MSSNSIIIEPFYSNVSPPYNVIYSMVFIFACWKLFTSLQKHYKIFNPLQTTDLHTKQNKFTIEKSILKESSIVLKLSLQIGLSLVFELCVETVSTTYFGHLPNSSQILSATGLAISFTNLSVVCISFGLCQGLWTLIPQAVGSNNTHLIALFVQRAFIISFIVELPLALVLIYSTQILKFIGVNKHGDIDWDIISNYCCALIPFPYLMFTLSIIHRVLQNVNYSNIILYIQGITFAISIPMNHIFIYTFNFGYIGGAIVYNLVSFLTIIISVIYLIHKGYSFIFKPLPMNQIFETKGIIQYLKLAFPGFIQTLLRWNIRESAMILTGYINNAPIIASCTAVMIQLNKIKLLHNGISNASGIRIGKYIGANSISYAKRCVKIQIFYDMLLMILTVIIYTIYRYKIVSFFTDNISVITLISDKLVYLCLFDQFSASMYIQVAAIYRALGYQNICAWIVCITQYLIVFPFQLYLLFGSSFEYYNNIETGIYVIWLGSSFGYLLASAMLIVKLIFFIDWNKAVEESKKRIEINNKNMLKYNKTLLLEFAENEHNKKTITYV